MSPPWMPLYIADYIADTGHLSAAESGAYLHLIMHYWRTGGALPKDDGALSRIARMSGRQWATSKETVLAFFDAELRHKRIDLELEKASLKSTIRAECGSRGGLAKSLKNKESILAKGTILPEQKDTFALASSSQPQSDTSSLRSDVSAKAREIESAFERFWEIWPNKVAKPSAKKSMAKVWKEIEEILPGVERYIRSKRPDRDWLHPATFLNDRRWEDSPAPSNVSLFTPSNAPRKVRVDRDSKQGKAWESHMASLGKRIPWVNSAWYFESEWPPPNAPVNFSEAAE